ncbi:hypothetical protein B0H16DRAFT_1526554, partial [Mycena metata]
MSMLQLANQGGKVIAWVSKQLYKGPADSLSHIADFFGEGEDRLRVLEELYANRNSPSHRLATRLRGHCHSLLKFARPDSQAVRTQIAVFKMLYSAITRYPGLRLPVYHDKDIRRAVAMDPALGSLWRRQHQNCGVEWEVYRNLAVFCISQSILTDLVEGEQPSALCRLTFIENNLNNVPVETQRLCAIRYLAGILVG